MRTLSIVVCLSLLCTPALSQLRSFRHSTEAHSTVRDYLRLDLEGARLTAESWPRMQALTTWKENPDWQAFTIVSRYDVVSANGDGLRAAVLTVKYGVLGRFQIGVGYTPDPGAETVDFRIRELDEGWRIEELTPVINPHVSRARAVQWLQAALLSEKDAGNKIAIEKALQALQERTKN